MEKTYKILLIVGVIIAVGGFIILLYNSQGKKALPQDNFLNANQSPREKDGERKNGVISDYKCVVNDDCILKSYPYCCGENLSYVDGCSHINKNPPKTLDCKGNGVCPGFLAIKDCVCVDKLCTPIHEE